ncbi:MAG: VanZ family protein [Oscillospiraceae bacterium]|nr:VanZ family protein [Oscillospiraceae bacterium]
MLILGFFLKAILYCIIFTPFYVLFRFLWRKHAKISFSWKKELLLFLFAQFLFVFISQTLTPQGSWKYWRDSFDLIKWQYLSMNLTPFKSIIHYLANPDNINKQIVLINLLANILITAPLGFFPPLLWQKWCKFWRVFLFGTILILAIETLQPLVLRSADIDDYILNILGISLGYAIWKVFSKLKNSSPKLP